MAQLGSTFDATQVQPSSDQLPAGWYTALISASEVKGNKNGTGQHLSLEFTITSEQFNGWKIWEQLNLWHSSQKASQIAQGKLSAVANAINVLQFSDSSALHNFNMQIRIAHNNEGRAEIKGFKAVETQGNQASPGRAFAEQPQGNQPQHQNPYGSATVF